MDMSFHIARNGLQAGTLRQSVIANNLSNLTTDGFRSRMVDAGTLSSPGTQVLGIRESQEVGAPRATAAKTDLYIAGEGFLRVATQDGTAYTRNDSLRIDGDGNLTTTAGQLLDPPITIPEDAEDLIIERDGTVLSLDAEGVTTELGQLELTRFRNPAGLLAIGDNLYVKGPNSGDEISGTAGEQGFGSLIQGALESSTVDPSTEITNQIVNQRYYQMNLRSFQTSDAIISRTLDLFS